MPIAPCLRAMARICSSVTLRGCSAIARTFECDMITGFDDASIASSEE